MLSPLIYANTMIQRALETGSPLSPLKLQKLLYLTYARYLYLYDEPLFHEHFERWRYGPVVSVVYDAFRRYKNDSIDDFLYDHQGRVAVVDRGDRGFYRCFNEVWERFGRCEGVQLSAITHNQGTAWSKVSEAFLRLEDIREDGRRLFAE
ncbi:MAG: DUF4065 domain-containing protein [Oscillospiraceae bacterium]|nr:DUF4065 domain-containing protein [Oscillospiraceae bacterium]